MLHDDEKSAKSKFFTLDIGWFIVGAIVGNVLGGLIADRLLPLLKGL